jgi:predicted DsbA family dithiol-disulfide isomerase
MGLQDRVKERLLRGYFTESLAIGDPEVLERLGMEAGLPPSEVADMLATDRFAAEVRADEERGRRFGINGVPFFAIDERYGVSGAQSSDVLLEALEGAWRDQAVAAE